MRYLGLIDQDRQIPIKISTWDKMAIDLPAEGDVVEISHVYPYRQFRWSGDKTVPLNVPPSLATGQSGQLQVILTFFLLFPFFFPQLTYPYSDDCYFIIIISFQTLQSDQIKELTPLALSMDDDFYLPPPPDMHQFSLKTVRRTSVYTACNKRRRFFHL